MKRFLLLMAVAAGLQSCSTETKTVYWVNSTQQQCDAGAGKALCLQVYKGDDLKQAEWEALYAPIEGFTFEEGYYKKIEVTEKQLKDVPADAPSVAYTLVREIEKQKDPRFELNGKWTLVNLEGITLGGKAPVMGIDLKQMRVNGSDSCNTFFGDIKTVTQQELVFGDLASTLMLCPDMVTADAFSAAMKEVQSYKITNQQLLLSNHKGEVLLTFSKTE